MKSIYQGCTKAGTYGGTMLCILGSLQWEDLAKSIVLAATGAAVSCTVSIFIKWLLEARHKKASDE